MKKQALVHLGLHKSGTSTVQQALSRSYDALKARGILYPISGRRRDGGGLRPAHHQLALQMNPRKRSNTDELGQIVRELAHEVAPYDRVLLSSEGLGPLPDYNALRDALPNYDLTALIYVRELGDYALSAYAQKVQSESATLSFDAFLDQFRPNLAKRIDTWQRHFDRVILRPFAPSLLDGGDLVADFCHNADLDPTLLTAVERQNPTISGNLLCFKLMVNQVSPQQIGGYKALRLLAQSDPRFTGKFQVSDDVLDRYRAHNFSSYGQVLQNLFPAMPLRSFADAPPLFQPDNWARDLEYFLSKPPFDTLRDMDCFKRGVTPPTKVLAPLP
jgi:hypothetical protein